MGEKSENSEKLSHHYFLILGKLCKLNTCTWCNGVHLAWRTVYFLRYLRNQVRNSFDWHRSLSSQSRQATQLKQLTFTDVSILALGYLLIGNITCRAISSEAKFMIGWRLKVIAR